MTEPVFGWHELFGKSVEEARALALRLLCEGTIRQAVWRKVREDAKALPPTPIYVIADDGFDDGAGYEPTLFFFWREDVKSFPLPEGEDPEYFCFYRATGLPFASEKLAEREWSTVQALCADNFGGGGAGIAAVIATATVSGRGVGNARWPSVETTIDALTWTIGKEFEADRVHPDAD